VDLTFLGSTLLVFLVNFGIGAVYASLNCARMAAWSHRSAMIARRDGVIILSVDYGREGLSVSRILVTHHSL
jgi:hypothetical protein